VPEKHGFPLLPPVDVELAGGIIGGFGLPGKPVLAAVSLGAAGQRAARDASTQSRNSSVALMFLPG